MTPLNLRENMNGIEWVVDAHGCAPEALRDPELLRKLFEQIISSLRLRQVGEAQWHQFPNSGGITGLCLLAESHLACHTFPEFGSLCLNLFCCVPREEWDFEAELTRAFGATSVSVRTVTRRYSETDELALQPAVSAANLPRETRRR
jgi:S-adenosylmethionine decarboxylase